MQENIGDEVWKAIPGYEGRYEISNFARVRMIANGSHKYKSPRIKTLCTNIYGYKYVSLRQNGTTYYGNVHRLMLWAFVSPPPSPIHLAAHNNGIRNDNRIENLRWATPKENRADMVLHGTVMRGESHPKAKLTNKTVHEIYAQIGSITAQDCAKKYGVGKNTIMAIWKGDKWSHLTGADPKRRVPILYTRNRRTNWGADVSGGTPKA